MLNFIDNNRTGAMMTILVLAVGSISAVGIGTTHVAKADQIGKACVFFACGNANITGGTSGGGGGGGQPTPNTGTLTVVKQCGGSTTSCRPIGFEIKVIGNNPSPDTFHDDGTGTQVTLGAGDYQVTEPSPGDFSVSFSGDCNPTTGKGTINAGETQTCKVINTPKTGTLIVIKKVICPAGVECPPASDFTISISGTPANPNPFPGKEAPGTIVAVTPGTYTVSETPPSGTFGKAFIGDCTNASISAGETKTCSIENTKTQ